MSVFPLALCLWQETTDLGKTGKIKDGRKKWKDLGKTDY